MSVLTILTDIVGLLVTLFLFGYTAVVAVLVCIYVATLCGFTAGEDQ